MTPPKTARERAEPDDDWVDVGYTVSPGGQKSHRWAKRADVPAYIVGLVEEAVKAERAACANELQALRDVHTEARELIGEADASGVLPAANLNALRSLLWRASLRKGTQP